MSLALCDVVDKMAGHRNLSLRLLAKAHTDSVANAVGEQCSYAHGTLDASVLALASLGHSKVKRIVHVGLVHLGNEQAHGAHHDDGVGGLDGNHNIVELLLLADAQELETALYDALWGIAVAVADAVGQREADAADAEQYDIGARLRDTDTPERELMRQEMEATVMKAVDGLPEELRTAITLREVEGLSYEEIAQKMDCPIGTVRSRIFRAREAIDEQLRPLLDTDSATRERARS